MEHMEKMTRMKELVEQLREASKAYYQESREIMSNYEYDARYDELLSLEQETGTTLAGSPTVQVGAGWSDQCADLRRRTTSEGGYARKR